MDAPHSPAAFINSIAEEGTKAEAVKWLQQTWNERQQFLAQRDELLEALKGVVAWLEQPVQSTGYHAPSSPDAAALAIIRGDCAAAKNLAQRAILKVQS